jgi:hypothetical protein
MAQVTEWQIGVANPSEWPLGQTPGYVGRYTDYFYCGETPDGLHLFTNNAGDRELFARRPSGAGWHLRHNRHSYEYVRDTTGE